MSVSRTALGAFMFECDTCPNAYDSGSCIFDNAWYERAKPRGWKTLNVKGAWQHSCPRCAALG
jgi:hypothetical protein